MITVNNVTLRNLQEQVLENKQKIAEHYSTDRVIAEFGIRVVGKVSSSTGLPGANDTYPLPAAPDYPGEYGDAYLVGTAEPYNMWIYSRPDPNSGYITNYWINVGPLNVIGPEGPRGEKGDKGDTGTRGSLWYGGVRPSFTANIEDKYVITSGANTGAVYTYTENGWSQIGSIRGPQGIQGIQGPIGLTGPQGPQGAAGKDGAPGQSFHVEGILANTTQLPTPTQAIRAGAYLVGNETDGYDLYIIIGGHNEGDELLWFNAGKVEGVEGPQGPQGPQGIQGPAGNYVVSMQDGEVFDAQNNRTATSIDVTMSDGTTTTFNVYAQNGAKGADGAKGDTGDAGPQGDPGPEGPAGTSINSIEQVAIGSDDEYTQTSLKAIMSDGSEIPFSVAAKNGLEGGIPYVPGSFDASGTPVIGVQPDITAMEDGFYRTVNTNDTHGFSGVVDTSTGASITLSKWVTNGMIMKRGKEIVAWGQDNAEMVFYVFNIEDGENKTIEPTAELNADGWVGGSGGGNVEGVQPSVVHIPVYNQYNNALDLAYLEDNHTYYIQGGMSTKWIVFETNSGTRALIESTDGDFIVSDTITKLPNSIIIKTYRDGKYRLHVIPRTESDTLYLLSDYTQLTVDKDGVYTSNGPKYVIDKNFDEKVTEWTVYRFNKSLDTGIDINTLGTWPEGITDKYLSVIESFPQYPASGTYVIVQTLKTVIGLEYVEYVRYNRISGVWTEWQRTCDLDSRVPIYTAVLKDGQDCDLGTIPLGPFVIKVDKSNTTTAWRNNITFTIEGKLVTATWGVIRQGGYLYSSKDTDGTVFVTGLLTNPIATGDKHPASFLSFTIHASAADYIINTTDLLSSADMLTNANGIETFVSRSINSLAVKGRLMYANNINDVPFDAVGDGFILHFGENSNNYLQVAFSKYGKIYTRWYGSVWSEWQQVGGDKDLVDSDTITVMEEDGQTKLNLAADVLADVNNSLKLPVSAPSSTELVGVTSGNSQTLMTLGDNLSHNAVLNQLEVAWNYVGGAVDDITDFWVKAPNNHITKLFVAVDGVDIQLGPEMITFDILPVMASKQTVQVVENVKLEIDVSGTPTSDGASVHAILTDTTSGSDVNPHKIKFWRAYSFRCN